MRLWLISLALEAVLAVLLTRRGGFTAFRRFLWYDVATQCLGIACSGSGAWYPLIHRWSEAGAVVLLGFVVAEQISATSRVAIATSGVAGCCLHLIFAAPVPWSAWASAVWQGVALSHSIMGILLLSAGTCAVSRILAVWMLADAALFYVAPHWPVGMAVLGLNAGTWGALIVRATSERGPCRTSCT